MVVLFTPFASNLIKIQLINFRGISFFGGSFSRDLNFADRWKIREISRKLDPTKSSRYKVDIVSHLKKGTFLHLIVRFSGIWRKFGRAKVCILEKLSTQNTHGETKRAWYAIEANG